MSNIINHQVSFGNQQMLMNGHDTAIMEQLDKLTKQDFMINAKLSGITYYYLPFYNISVTYNAIWSASCGYKKTVASKEYQYKYVNGKRKQVQVPSRKEVTDYRPREGKIKGNFSAFIYAGNQFSHIRHQLESFQIIKNTIIPYSPQNVKNTVVESCCASDNNISQGIHSGIQRSAKSKACSNIPTAEYRNLVVKSTSNSYQKSTILLPIFKISYSYNNSTYNFWHNGSTGDLLAHDTIPDDVNNTDSVYNQYLSFYDGRLKEASDYGKKIRKNYFFVSLIPFFFITIACGSVLSGFFS
jgi:hypothetical protein